MKSRGRLSLLPKLSTLCILALASSAGIADAEYPPPPDEKGAANDAEVQACSLVSPNEVGAIQGAVIVEPKSSKAPYIDFLLSECYYGSLEPAKSVTLGVIQPNPRAAGTRSVTAFWHETFDNNDKREETKKDEGARPQKVEGLGEDAYWLGNPKGGILYVLKTDRMLRITFNGPGTADEKLAKSKSLATKALSRLK